MIKKSLDQSLYLLSSKTSYRQSSWNIQDVRLGAIMIVPLWNLSNFGAIRIVLFRISRPRDLRLDVRPLSE